MGGKHDIAHAVNEAKHKQNRRGICHSHWLNLPEEKRLFFCPLKMKYTQKHSKPLMALQLKTSYP